MTARNDRIAKIARTTVPGTAETAKRAEAKGKAKAKGKIDATKPTGAIVVHKAAETGNGILVQAANGHSFVRPIYGDSKEFRKVAAVGQPYDAARKWDMANPAQKPKAQLARGVEARQAPHSAKAVADQPKADAKGKKAAKAAAPKAKANKQPSAGANRAYTKGKTAINAKPGSWRHHMLTTMQKAKDTDSAKAAHAKSGNFSANKLDFNWAASQGYIVWAK